MKWTEKKAVRYGTLSAGLTVAVIAVIIVLNVIVSAIFSLVGANLDMTADDLFEVSEESHALLEQVNADDNQITIYFLTDPDNLNQVANASYGLNSSGLWGMKYIHELALELDEKYSYITVDYIDLTKEPAKVRAIVGDQYDNMTLNSQYVIIDNYTPERDSKGNIINGADGKPSSYWHNYRIYSRDSFYSFNTSTYGVIGFKGDYRFCSTILSVTKDVAPTAYILTGHGETVGSYTVGEDSTDFGDAANLWNILHDSGYNIRHINLQYEDFEADENALAIIFSPKSDYLSGTTGSADEISKLKTFLESSGHSLMVCLDPDTRALPNLEGLLGEMGGVSVGGGKLKNDGTSSVTVDGYSLVGQFANDGNRLSERMAPIAADSKVIFRLARPIFITDSDKAKAVYTLPEGCVAESGDGSSSEVTEAALFTLSEVRENAYIMVCGTSMLSYSSYTENPGYANLGLTVAALGIASDDSTAEAVRSRVIPNEGLDLTTHEATVWTVVLSVGLPLVVAVIGTCIFIRRRHS